ncbi:MAG: glycosyltransferase [Prevotella sp.]|nr:glycosyltransferase [Prevotella sp.]
MMNSLFNDIWASIAPTVYKFNVLFSEFRYMLFGKRIKDYHMVPIYINNFNRLSYVKELIEGLEKRGYNNIHIIDNNSTYPPLLEYYKTCQYDVIRLEENVGFISIWKTGMYKHIWNSYYVYTDSDILLGDDCPEDFMKVFIDILDRYKLCHKVGFALSISDLPDCFAQKNEVIKHESQFWEKEIEPGLYDARIDTTFALYRPFCKGPSNSYKFVIRAGGKYTCRHQPWYVDTNNPPKEEIDYINSVRQSTHWSAEVKKIKS